MLCFRLVERWSQSHNLEHCWLHAPASRRLIGYFVVVRDKSDVFKLWCMAIYSGMTLYQWQENFCDIDYIECRVSPSGGKGGRWALPSGGRQEWVPNLKYVHHLMPFLQSSCYVSFYYTAMVLEAPVSSVTLPNFIPEKVIEKMLVRYLKLVV